MMCALVIVAACGHGPSGSACPVDVDPSHMTQAELERANIAGIPKQGATTKANVDVALKRSRRFFKQNYAGIVQIGTGKGWGVTYSQDQYGNQTFHHAPDVMIVVLMDKRDNCPDPDRGTLFLYGKEDLRVPVRFLYRGRG
jgi:hypothetical protein